MRFPIASFAILSLTAAAVADITPFTSEAGSRGISYAMMPYPPISGYYGFGCGFVDFDSDGDLDVIAVGAANGTVGLFENLGGSFANRTAMSGIFPMTALSSFAAADYDNDGDEDLFLSRVDEPSMLFRNDGNFQFFPVTFAAGIDTDRLAKGACWGDYDNDGWLDLFICNYFFFFGGPNASENQLYRNNGDGTFTDVAPALGLNSTGASLEAVWTDYDRDGDLDLYVSNDRGPYTGFPANQLYRNNGNGTFTDVSVATNADARLFSMGLACGDIDGDGRVDFYCTNTTDPAPPLLGAFPLLLQQKSSTFVEAQVAWGVAHPTTDWGWGSTFFDWNNDGRLDLYVHDQFSANSLFENTGSLPMLDIAAAAGIAGSNGASYCSSYADIDNDGDIDVLMNNMGEPLTLFINREGEKRNAIRLRVVSEFSASTAVGANADLVVGRTTIYRESYAGGNGYLGQNEMHLHFGLGSSTIASSATVRWPSAGPVRALSSIPPGSWTIYPPEKLGDADGNGSIGAADRLALCDAAGAVVPGTERLDMNGDFVVDGGDVALFRVRFEANGARWSDLNGDAVVNAADLAVLLGAWGSADCLKDLNGNGSVDAADLSVLLGDWG